MIRAVMFLPFLLGPAWARQDATSVQSLLDAMAAIGRIQGKAMSEPAPCIYLRTPSGESIVGAHSPPMNRIKPAGAPFEVVFQPDAPQPKPVAATLLGQDHHVAWFKLDGPAPVKPVDIRNVPGLRRGGTLYIAGVRTLGPGLTVNQLALGVAQAVRYDDRQECMYVRSDKVDRDVKPVGLFDVQGRLAALSTNEHWPMTPAEILDSLEGTVISTEARGLKDEAGRLKGRLELNLCNPFGKLKGVTALLLQKHQVKEWPQVPDSSGRWPLLGDPASEVKIAIDGNAGSADLNVPMDPAQERYWAFQYRIVRGDGSVRHSSWAFIDGRELRVQPRFSRSGEEPPPVRRPASPDAPPKLANVTTGSPVATGLSLVSRIEVIRGAQITRTVDLGITAACWSTDYRHVFVLDGQNMVRKIAVPELREVCEYGVGYECSDLRRSAEGLVVMVSGLDELWILSAGNLSVKTRIPLGKPAKVSMGENASTAWVSSSTGELLAMDLSAGRIAKRHTAASLGAGAAKAVRPATVEHLSFSKVEVSPNGQHVVVLGSNQLHRFSVNGFNLVYEEIGPWMPVPAQGFMFSPDSYYLVASLSSGRSMIHRTRSFESTVVEYTGVEVLGFDKAAGVLYGRHPSGPGFSILRPDGLVERTMATTVHAKKILVHPEGSKVLLLGHQLALVEILE